MNEESKTTENEVENKVEEVGKFTQEQVNSIVKKEKEKILSGIPSKEELDAFKTWKDNQKTNEEKLVDLEVKYKDTMKTNSELSHVLEVVDSGVKKQFRKFVATEVNAMEGDFTNNLKEYLKEHTEFLADNTVKTVNTAPKMSGKEEGQNVTNEIMNDLIRSIKNK